MPTVQEAVSALKQMRPDLRGLQAVSLSQEIVFAQYVKYVLPLDGYVFWLRTQELLVSGSLHVSSSTDQKEDETAAINRVLFTTGEEVQQFNSVSPNTLWIGEFQDIKFAFSAQESFYRVAGLHHYVGDAVYPALYSQLTDVGSQLDPATLVVSNSLPAWLQMYNYEPIWLLPKNPKIQLYPSFVVPDNLRPPYGTVHIAPEGTQALQAAPVITATSSHFQLSSDKVRVTLYGLTNDQAMDWVDLVYQYIRDNTLVLGMMDIPIIRDEKRTQSELSVIAMKKTFELTVSYVQGSIRDLAQQMITSATATITPQLNGV